MEERQYSRLEVGLVYLLVVLTCTQLLSAFMLFGFIVSD
jgi:hypothetical protein